MSFQIGHRMACVAGLLPPLMRSGGYSPANVASEIPPREALSPRLATLRGGLNSRPVFLHPLANVRQDLPYERIQPDHLSAPFDASQHRQKGTQGHGNLTQQRGFLARSSGKSTQGFGHEFRQ